MTTPEPEQDDPRAVEQDDVLLDAAASGAPVEDPAAALLAQIARAVEEPTSGGSEGDGGGPRHLRTLWGTALGVSVALALGSGLGVAAYGEFAPHSAPAVQSGFAVPDVPSPTPGSGGVTVTVSAERSLARFEGGVRPASLLGSQLPGDRTYSQPVPTEVTRASTGSGHRLPPHAVPAHRGPAASRPTDHAPRRAPAPAVSPSHRPEPASAPVAGPTTAPSAPPTPTVRTPAETAPPATTAYSAPAPWRYRTASGGERRFRR